MLLQTVILLTAVFEFSNSSDSESMKEIWGSEGGQDGDAILLGFWRCADSSVDANVSEKHTAAIFWPDRWQPRTSLHSAQNPEVDHHKIS
jgi:hypothetical protein